MFHHVILDYITSYHIISWYMMVADQQVLVVVVRDGVHHQIGLVHPVRHGERETSGRVRLPKQDLCLFSCIVLLYMIMC